MNKIEATVINIDNIDNLNIVKFSHDKTTLSMMSLDLPNVKVGSNVILGVKASDVAIAKNLQGDISLSNQIQGKIVEFEKGELLSSIKVASNSIEITSIITTNSANRMNLKLNDEVSALIKASSLSIKEVL